MDEIDNAEISKEMLDALVINDKFTELEIEFGKQLVEIFKKEDGLCEKTEEALYDHLKFGKSKWFGGKVPNKYSSGRKYHFFDEIGVFIELDIACGKDIATLFCEDEIQSYAKSYRVMPVNLNFRLFEQYNTEHEDKKDKIELLKMPKFIKVFEFKPDKI